MAHLKQGLRVIQPGILTLVQDSGRYGYQHLGLTTGGAADEHAFLWANRLLGNPSNSAALEICIGGLEVEAQTTITVAITGADIQAQINKVPIRPWQSYRLAAGDQLQFGYCKSGTRAYLAVRHGLKIASTYGSVATVMREKIGGLSGDGSPLQAGDILPCIASDSEPLRRAPPQYIPDYRQPLTLRVIEERQRGFFSDDDFQLLYHSEYRISPQSDRMGARLFGAPLRPKVDGIISEGTNFGAIQIPPDGQPIVLLKDRQTIGGYPKIGTLLPLDAFALSQRHPGATLHFAAIELARAQEVMGDFYRFFRVGNGGGS